MNAKHFVLLLGTSIGLILNNMELLPSFTLLGTIILNSVYDNKKFTNTN